MSTKPLAVDASTVQSSEPVPTANQTPNQLVSYWPIIFVVFGGLLGLLMGGIAAAINKQIMKSSLPAIVKYPLVILTGVVAFFGWFVLVALINEAVA